MKETKTLTLSQCNVIKVSMMLMVIFYHSICLWGEETWFIPAAESSKILAFFCKFLNSIHIYVFTFVSGFLFYFLKYEKKRYHSLLKDVGDRAKRLLFPYIVVAVLWVVPFSIYYFHTEPLIILRNYFFGESPSQLWFLLMLFVVFCLFYLLADFFYKHNFFVGGIFCAFFYIIGFIGERFIPNVFQIWTALKYIFYYWLGFYFCKEKTNFFYKIPFFVYLIVFFFLFCCNYFFIKKQEGIFFSCLSIILSPVINTFGVLTVVVGVSKINTKDLENTKFLKFLEKYNFTMYLFHQQLIYMMISLLNGKAPIWIMVIVNLIVALVGSMVISIIISKIPKIRCIFGYKEKDKK